LKVDISSIIKDIGSSLAFKKTGSSDIFMQGDDKVPLAVPIVVEGVATCTSDGIYIQANIKGVAHLTCSRCLREYDQEFELSCEGRFQKRFTSPVSSEEGDFVENFALEGDFCVLDDMIKHELILSLPMKPLCSPDCKGLEEHEEYEVEDEPTAFGRKLLEAIEEGSKTNGSTKKKDLGI